MSIIDSFLDMFRRKPEDGATENPKDVEDTPKASPTVNSITLSPDMSTLFLIDNGRAIPFDLTSRNGVVIGTLDGQLTVATALPNIVGTPTQGDPDTPGGGDSDDEGPIKRVAIRPRFLKLPTRSRQWTLMFVKGKLRSVISIIGASDIDTSIIGASDIDTSIIGASDIDTSLTRGVDSGIIGASDIDTSLTRSRSIDEPQETAPAAEGASVHTNCRIYSFLINTRSIQLRKTGTELEIEY